MTQTVRGRGGPVGVQCHARLVELALSATGHGETPPANRPRHGRHSTPRLAANQLSLADSVSSDQAGFIGFSRSGDQVATVGYYLDRTLETEVRWYRRLAIPSMRFGAVELDTGLTRWRRCRTSSRFGRRNFTPHNVGRRISPRGC